MYEESCNGLGEKYSISCDKCKHNIFFNCKIIDVVFLPSEYPTGVLESLRSFCGVMNFPAPVQNSSFTKIRKQLLNVTCDVAHKFMTDAIEEEIKLTHNSSKETVAVDDSNQEAIRRLSIENLEQEDMSENESELTNTPN
ncbi:hypothetical protein TSAR_008508 [Trichomalopsis sarcophagae]|uniref:Uncharacterized protein n=1 Tax=Trichomalopsis sarcophagae TaxID=543379 RepID=A0A232EKR7_9HYME|nr:hypothetical protein TSAR_008508 [Trichomalopsis sarcophagae]